MHVLSGCARCTEHRLMGAVNQKNGVRKRGETKVGGPSASIQHVTVCTVGWLSPFLEGALM